MIASVWFANNDMVVQVANVRSSTMSSTAYLNSSTGITCAVWKALTTASTSNRVVNATNMPYSTGTNGTYKLTIQSTAHTMSTGTAGMAVITLTHSGLDAEWRPQFVVSRRRST